jgi:hypothetical protein
MRVLFIIIFFGYGKVVYAEKVEFTFPAAYVAVKQYSFAVPMPMVGMEDSSKLSLLKNGSPIPFSAFAHLKWPSRDNKTFIRGLTITISTSINIDDAFVIRWGDKEKTALSPMKDINLLNYISAKYSVSWLSNILYAPIRANDKQTLKWFQRAYLKFADYVTDDIKVSKAKNKISYKNAAPWLYDHPYTLYQLYFKTGDSQWLQAAHSAALFYEKNISPKGYFILKKRHDIKYLIPTGLLIDYIFYPRKSVLDVINRMYKNSLSWPVTYKKSQGFWTERHLASALSLAITEWEVADNSHSLSRVLALIEGTKSSMVYGENSLGGCIQHQLSAHEETKDKTMVCSSWMNALIVEQLWRFYLLTSNEDSKSLIIALANQVLDKGTYRGWGVHMKKYTVPRYLQFFKDSKRRELDQWTDMHHACDVASMLSKAAFLLKQDGKEYLLQKNMTTSLLQTCRKTLSRSNVVKTWSISPLRKFNWWFSSTGSLEWLIEQL